MFRYVKYEGDEMLESTVSGETAAKILSDIVRMNAKIVDSLCSVICITDEPQVDIQIQIPPHNTPES